MIVSFVSNLHFDVRYKSILSNLVLYIYDITLVILENKMY